MIASTQNGRYQIGIWEKAWDPFMKLGLLQRIDRVFSGLFPERRVFLNQMMIHALFACAPRPRRAFWGRRPDYCLVDCGDLDPLIDSIGAGNFREQAIRDQETYQQRLQIMASERDASVKTASAVMAVMRPPWPKSPRCKNAFGPRVDRLELSSGVDVLQSNLNAALVERSELTTELERAQSENDGSEDAQTIAKAATQDTATIDYLTTALRDTAQERDKIIKDAQAALNQAEELRIEMRLMEERNELIFRQIEEAMNVSIGPLDKMFRASGQDPERIMSTIRQGICGYGGPLTSMSTRGLAPTENERAQSPS